MSLTDGNGKNISLLEYIKERFLSLEKAIDREHETMGERMAKMNEFREALSDQSKTMVTKTELEGALGKIELQLTNIDRDVRILLASKNRLEGKASQSSVFFAGAIAIAALILAALKMIMK